MEGMVEWPGSHEALDFVNCAANHSVVTSLGETINKGHRWNSAVPPVLIPN